MTKKEFIDANLDQPEFRQRWPSYKERMHQLGHLYDRQVAGEEEQPVAPPAEPEDTEADDAEDTAA